MDVTTMHSFLLIFVVVVVVVFVLFFVRRAPSHTV